MIWTCLLLAITGVVLATVLWRRHSRHALTALAGTALAALAIVTGFSVGPYVAAAALLLLIVVGAHCQSREHTASMSEIEMTKPKNLILLAATVLIALYIGGGGAAKLAGIPYFHSSFPKLGLPAWFGYFIGTCEVFGAISLFVRPLSALVALGLLVIMVGATYYHATYTPLIQATPAFILALLCTYVFIKRRKDILTFNGA